MSAARAAYLSPPSIERSPILDATTSALRNVDAEVLGSESTRPQAPINKDNYLRIREDNVNHNVLNLPMQPETDGLGPQLHPSCYLCEET